MKCMDKKPVRGLQNVALVVVITVNFTVISSEKIPHDLNCMMVNIWLITVGHYCALSGGQKVGLQTRTTS